MFEVSTTSFHTNFDERRLVAERANFAEHVTVSAGVGFGGKGRLHFIHRKQYQSFRMVPFALNLTDLVQISKS